MAAMNGHLDVCMLLLRKKADRSAVNRNGSTASDMAFDAGFRDLASMLSPDVDIRSVYDSSGLDPPCSESDENLERSSPLVPAPTLEESALTTSHPSVTENCVEISLERLEEQSETGIPHRPRRNSHLQGDLTSFTKPGDDREATVSPVPRKRPSGRNESPDDPTSRMNPKRSRNYR